MPPIASPIEGPIFNGIGAQSTTERGISLIRNRIGAGVYSSSNPSCCTINFISNDTPESAAIGIMITFTPRCTLTKFSSDKLTFIITENNLRYTKTLLFIYNPCAN